MIRNYRELGLKDFTNGNAREYMEGRIEMSDAGVSDERYDPFGARKSDLVDFMTFLLFFYKFYFRTDVTGLENLPEDGPGLIVANHAPILPVDGMMIGVAAMVEPERPRLVRAIISRNFAQTPFFSALMSRIGQVTGSDDNVRRIFENRHLMLVFPTGSKEGPHSIFNRYRLDEFQVGFMEYALKYGTPVIPAAVVGSEEAAMMLGKLKLNVFGFKTIPLTPVFPWFGLAGLMPFPAKFRIRFGTPVDYYTDRGADVNDPAKVRELVQDLRSRLQVMLDEDAGR